MAKSILQTSTPGRRSKLKRRQSYTCVNNENSQSAKRSERLLFPSLNIGYDIDSNHQRGNFASWKVACGRQPFQSNSMTIRSNQAMVIDRNGDRSDSGSSLTQQSASNRIRNRKATLRKIENWFEREKQFSSRRLTTDITASPSRTQSTEKYNLSYNANKLSTDIDRERLQYNSVSRPKCEDIYMPSHKQKDPFSVDKSNNNNKGKHRKSSSPVPKRKLKSQSLDRNRIKRDSPSPHMSKRNFKVDSEKLTKTSSWPAHHHHEDKDRNETFRSKHNRKKEKKKIHCRKTVSQPSNFSSNSCNSQLHMKPKQHLMRLDNTREMSSTKYNGMKSSSSREARSVLSEVEMTSQHLRQHGNLSSPPYPISPTGIDSIGGDDSIFITTKSDQGKQCVCLEQKVIDAIQHFDEDEPIWF